MKRIMMMRRRLRFGWSEIKPFLRLVVLGLCVPGIVVGAFRAVQYVHYRHSVARRRAGLEAGPRVKVCPVTLSAQTQPVFLMGETCAYLNVTLYAKVSGFLKEVKVDKGDKVSAGDLLAVIDSPELDQQYDAAVADAKDKRLDADRAKALIKSGSISEQQRDHMVSAADVAESKAASLKTMKDYQVIRSPFAGLVTARYADPGALVQQAVQQQGPALPIVTLAEIDRLRVYAYPDQTTASLIKVGDRAEIRDEARPRLKATGTVDRTSGEIDPKTRTLLVEIDVDNHGMRLLPGSFVQVALHVQSEPMAEVPVEALVIRGEKDFVAVVGPDNTLSFRPVTIFDSDGKVVRLSSGVKEGERVALNVGDSVEDGHHIQPVSAIGD